MLYRLEIENFYSVRDPQVVDLRVAANAPDEGSHFGPLYRGSKDRVPRTVALFGPNGSGKSTVLRALAFLGWFVQDSFLRLAPDAGQPCERFNAKEAEAAPTRLAIHFAAPVDLAAPYSIDSPHCRYAYELALQSVEGRPRNVISEILKHWPNERGKPLRVFERTEVGSVAGGKAFGLAGYKSVIDKVRPNASLIAMLAQFDHAPSLLLRRIAGLIFTNIFIEKQEFNEEAVVLFYAQHPDALKALNRDIERIDLGIRSVQIQPGATGPVAQFVHHGLASALPMHLESHGTRQIFKIFPLLLQALVGGGIAVVDELDLAVHPLVLPEIVGWFQDPSRNKDNAQLWITCQNASLLEALQKEEIFFCEKDSRGRTRIYGLQEVQDVRRSDNYYKKYLGGVYGAVPQLG
jgi:predicted ATPase